MTPLVADRAPEASSPRSPKPVDRFYPRLFAVAALGLLGWFLYEIFRPFLGPIVWSILLAFVLQPAYEMLIRRWHRKRGTAAGFLTAAATIGVVIPAALFAMTFSRQTSQLLTRVSDQAGRLQIDRPADLLRLAPVEAASDWLQVHLSVSRDDLQMRATEMSRRLLE